MSLIDFEMTFPAFVLLKQTGQPVTFDAEGDQTIALFTDEDLLRQFLSANSLGSPIRRGRITTSEALLECLQALLDEAVTVISAPTHILIDPSPGKRARCHPISEFVELLRERNSKSDLTIRVLPSFQPLAQLGQVRLQQMANEWLQTPVAKECGVSAIRIAEDLALSFSLTVEHALEDAEEIHFPFDNLLMFMAENGLSDAPQLEVKETIRVLRRRVGPRVYQRYRIDMRAMGPKMPLFLNCKTEGCNNSMQTQFLAYGNERIRGGPFIVECPNCKTEHEYLEDDLHFLD